ncbi:hypothetical protein CTI12_AA007860 [Artemisia annua]|uniref:Uncharacterized protein n=1 Tax=Artemisia annua TaxID=35608 RepID=A0A2U1Q0M9_ARTAN|nr:hypothetical protein CTI12_AA007860 [Artemisia annua]
MAANFTAPLEKKPARAFRPTRGRIIAKIFGEIAETLVSAASRAVGYFGIIKKNDASAAVASPITTVVVDGQDGKAF